MLQYIYYKHWVLSLCSMNPAILSITLKLNSVAALKKVIHWNIIMLIWIELMKKILNLFISCKLAMLIEHRNSCLMEISEVLKWFYCFFLCTEGTLSWKQEKKKAYFQFPAYRKKVSVSSIRVMFREIFEN